MSYIYPGRIIIRKCPIRSREKCGLGPTAAQGCLEQLPEGGGAATAAGGDGGGPGVPKKRRGAGEKDCGGGGDQPRDETEEKDSQTER
jgi:hypothetical protein